MQTEEPKVKPAWEEEIPIAEEEDSKVEVDAIGTIAPDDAYEVRTRHSFATHPISKGVVVLSGAFLVMSVLGIFLKAMMGGFSSNTVKVTPKPTPSAVAPNSIAEADTLKAKLLQANQSKEIEEFKRQKRVQQTSAQQPLAQPIPKATSIQSDRYVNAPRPIYSSQLTYPARIQTRLSVPVRPVTPTPVRVAPRTETPRQEIQDPMQQWLMVSNIGSYSSMNSAPTTPTRLRATDSTNTPLPTAAMEQRISNREKAATVPTNLSVKAIVGTSVKGEVETPLVWIPNASLERQNFRIKVTEPLKAMNGIVVLPKDSFLVAQMTSSNSAGYIQADVEQVLIPLNGQYSLADIPNDSLLIQGKDGNPLKAKVIRDGPSQANRILGLAALSAVSKVAGEFNQSTITTAGGVTTITDGDPNYGAAAVEGFTESVVRQGTASASRSLQPRGTAIVLKKGTPVNIYVNQTFGL